ncbi:MAG TPA: RlmE family RNA methyltransferase [Rhodocyclaceae bacterium]|jgi:23S rRNA (uridine2552-2'-O)-methyltransferase
MNQHVHDPYVIKAKHDGWRSRAVFKLIEIDEKDRLFKPGMTVVDLGCTPGSWSEYVVKRIQPGGRLIGLDLLPMDPIPGVTFIQGDFREDEPLAQLVQTLDGRQVDLVISDMAPNMTGISATDQAGVMYLAELTLEFAKDHLKTGGSLLTKVFQGSSYMELRKEIMSRFDELHVRKPAASRDRSAETYLLARGKQS